MSAVFGVGQLVTVLLALGLNRHYHLASTAAFLVAVLPTLPGAYLSWAAYRADRAEAADDLDMKARALAATVKASERDQVAQLLGAGGQRINVAFHCVQQGAGDAEGAASRGKLSDVLAFYRGLRPGRLVITGEPGAGKTLLALQLLLDVLDDRQRTDADPVPVRVSLASWDTAKSLTMWLTEQIHQRYAGQGITAADAYALVHQRRVLPVLDGLDEMDTATAVGRHRAAAALSELNAYQDVEGSAPLVLTCRSQQYNDLAAVNLWTGHSARVEIQAVKAGAAAAYLAARTALDQASDRWQPVLDTLSTDPYGTLAGALATPWHLNLAATVYSQRDPHTLNYVRDPADLLALPSLAAVREHLLARHIEAATAQHPGPYTPAEVHQWLGRLARHLAGPTGTAPTTDLVLHQLWPLPGPRRVRVANALLTAALLAIATAAVLLSHPSGSSRLGLGGYAALALVPLFESARSSAAHPAPIHRPRLSDVVQRRQLRRSLGPDLALVLTIMWVGALGFGLKLALALGLPLTLAVVMGALRKTDGDNVPVLPSDPRRQVRDALVIELPAALLMGLGIAAFGLGKAGVDGLVIGLMVTVLLAHFAAGRYLAFLCVCRGRILPWRLGAFLNWCYDAGLLRISGIAYQFRHRELQDWLADHPYPRPAPGAH
ncbi:NACHT domain-containing protein [Streptomyces chartreusis]|uniref:NACHT domain-containing protein n=1 Tax=Streptomyces chartreusis TaxID=1969 RepID=UPI0037B81BF3